MIKINRYMISLLAVISIVTNAEEYVSKSIFSADYKCIAEETGGFNHSSSGHKLALFKPDEEFFLVHISNIPKNALFEMKTEHIVSSLNHDENRVRQEVERSYMKQKIYTKDIISEESSYFIRLSSDNPEKASTYLLGGCSAHKMNDKSGINCYEHDSSKTFQFDLKTGKFAFAYVGSWHNENEKDYYGDSSIFSFGKCKEYYR